ncbi:hypothetical protein [Microcoleus sp. FACHB-672]|uniref:hypothetical protein n=1 Tax=Microcoleus sp. FACHB-672 TaxID=2692825 RepID=UPI001689E3A4|nr:hypothetical protein [Microcoleus sp. FACHB-672]MBD2039893.1 hypothetical protein [Microcoleus sp. FACHB-672]
MVLASSYSFDLNSSFLPSIPDPLKELLNKIRQQHYEELYEPEAEGSASLQDALNEILEEFRISDPTLCHLRYTWMTLILVLVVEPTVEYYQPLNSLPKKLINSIVLWLFKASRNLSNYDTSENVPNSSKFINEIFSENNLNCERSPASFQIINEALDVFYNALLVLDYKNSIQAILEILDDCLEGYAIFPGSCGRRELLDWWILEVVPASWYLLPPKSFYVVEGLQNREEIELRQASALKRISFVMRSLLQQSELSQVKSKFPIPNSIYIRTSGNKEKIGTGIRRDSWKSLQSLNTREYTDELVAFV